jgi:hypothetical protein
MRVGGWHCGKLDDSLDKCPGTVNPDQLDDDDDGIDDVCELPPGCCDSLR